MITASRKRLAVAAGLPGLALISWGCAFPFLNQVDALALTYSASGLAGVYGTEFLLLLPLALALGVVFALGLLLTSAFVPQIHRAPFQTAISHLSFFTIAVVLVRLSAGGWLPASWLIQTRWWLLAALVGGLVLHRLVPSVLLNMIWLGKLLAILGLICVPFAFISPLEATAPAPFEAARTRPNILLVTLDALAARQMSTYGAPLPTTPAIDSIAEGSLVFERAYSAANFTTPGANSLLTGLYPSEHRAVQLLATPTASARSRSIPALLRSAGYKSAYVSTNPHAAPNRNGYGQWFDLGVPDAINRFDIFCADRWARLLPYHCAVGNPLLSGLYARLTRFDRDNRAFDPAIAAAAGRRLLSEKDERPFFLWVHFLPPHNPYAAPGSCLGRFDSRPGARDALTSNPRYGWAVDAEARSEAALLEARYRESLACADHEVGALVREARERLGPSLVIVITADHGESFELWSGHGGPLLEEDLIRIPLIVRFGDGRPGRRSHVAASQTDVLPILQAVLAGSDEEGIEQLVAARRRRSPVLAMQFVDSPRVGPLTRGTIAAIGPSWKYVRYLPALHTPTGQRREEFIRVGPRTADGDERMALKAATNAFLARTAGRVTAD